MYFAPLSSHALFQLPPSHEGELDGIGNIVPAIFISTPALA